MLSVKSVRERISEEEILPLIGDDLAPGKLAGDTLAKFFDILLVNADTKTSLLTSTLFARPWPL